MNPHGTNAGFPVEPADIAIPLMKAHQPMNLGDSIECCVDGAFRVVSGSAGNLDLDEGAEKRPGATNAIGGDCHRLPIFFSRLR